LFLPVIFLVLKGAGCRALKHGHPVKAGNPGYPQVFTGVSSHPQEQMNRIAMNNMEVVRGKENSQKWIF
jgi:hypothetical protein